MQQLSKFSIYTIAHRDKLAKAASRSGATKFSEAEVWKTGYDLWSKAKAAGQAMAVVFADAADCSRLLYWGVLTDIVIEDKSTRYSFKQLRKIKGRHSPQELLLRTGKAIAPNFIRPYAICRTPSFLAEAAQVAGRIEDIGTKKDRKFILTHWTDDFDYDGLTNSFSILGEFYNLAEARVYMNESVNRLTAEQLSEHAAGPSWYLMSTQGKTRPIGERLGGNLQFGVNKNNKVVDYRSFKLGDGTGINSVYNYLELIELPKDAEVNEKLFDLENCGYEVRRYFEEQRKK